MGAPVDDPTRFADLPRPGPPARPDPLTEPAPTPAAAARLAVVDKLRGLVIVLMVLDHVRDFFHAGQFSPTDLGRTTAALFATRWVTHLCAPTFVLLAGVAVRLQRERGKHGRALGRFLLLRGLWLIALEVTLVTPAFDFAWPFTFPWNGALLQVIWAIGASMVLLAPLAAAPPRALLALGLAIVAGHDLLDGVPAAALGALAPAWTLMLAPGVLRHAFGGSAGAYVAYPALPWFGIMAVGVGVGDLFQRAPARRDRILAVGGLALLAGFVLLRGLDRYGDPSPWTAQPDALRTVLSFLNVTKYPPSLLYVLATLGVTLALAPLVERIGGPPGRALHAFGHTPLFTYLLHLYVARGLAVLLALAEGLPPGVMAFSEHGRATGWGVSLPWVYVAWLAVLLILWPLSTWFAGAKARRRAWWLSYL